jgi:hypothetical protein
MSRILALQRLRAATQPLLAVSTSSINCGGYDALESTCTVNCTCGN